ncbi:Acyl-CoA N-acyltransferase [Penicillium nucicola]|uniref:Acyl-CoA N-acyltransferase n=1 Tax=Penicillium nucicola TaxID=1850975 RepID=UPI002545074E|nr:Acyl-CoA N-acyltransferase [Penicillium nucicola]KAJ5771053.1 Acyl-CoA N-acyltransferase [Penicillium nucicola]
MASVEKKCLPLGYSLHDGYPSTPEYLHLRSAAGLSPKTPSQAAAVPTGSWYGCYITFKEDDSTPKAVAMGRIIGDGGWYFHIADMAVDPGHQRKGLGDAILKALLAKIKQDAPADGKPYISLLADGPGRPLYAKNGFVESAPASLGMVLKN